MLGVEAGGSEGGVGDLIFGSFIKDKKTKEPMPAAIDVADRIMRHSMPAGLLVRPLSHCTVLSPPLIISKAQIDELVAILRRAIEATTDELIREGLWKAPRG